MSTKPVNRFDAKDAREGKSRTFIAARGFIVIALPSGPLLHSR
jgi:hypothetical protein